jgi:AraC family transcriptional regulator
VDWHLRHPKPSLFWFRDDFRHLAASVDGAPVDCALGADADMCIVPAGVEVRGRFRVGPTVEYTAIFIEPRLLDVLPEVFMPSAKLGFGHPWLRQSLADLQREVQAQDRLSGLIAEGWALQAIAHIARATNSNSPSQSILRGGLAPWQERRAKEMLEGNLDGAVSVSELAAECGVSVAHFARAFRRSTGVPPHRWLLERRIDLAKQLLQESADSIAEVALCCGFSDQSHLTHTFRRQVGISPGMWRRLRAR